MDRARRLAVGTARDYWRHRRELEAAALSPEAAVRAGLETRGRPVVLIEAADCAGGGASGDSVASLAALLALEDPPPALVPVVDPEAAEACHPRRRRRRGLHRPRPQARPRLGPADPGARPGGEPPRRTLPLHSAASGTAWTGRWDRRPCWPSGRCGVLVTSHATYDWADEQWRAAGIDPRQTRFVVAKNPMNFHNVYDGGRRRRPRPRHSRADAGHHPQPPLAGHASTLLPRRRGHPRPGADGLDQRRSAPGRDRPLTGCCPRAASVSFRAAMGIDRIYSSWLRRRPPAAD